MEKKCRKSLQENVLLTIPTKLSRNNKAAHPYPCREFTLKESFWFALTSFTPQGGGEAPKSMSGRVLVAAYWLFVVLMLATFTANLAGMVTNPIFTSRLRHGHTEVNVLVLLVLLVGTFYST